MASTYTGLGTELMVTGEAAGTWGTKTNTNLKILEQISGGYVSIALNTTGATTLAVSDGAATDANQVAHRCMTFTASLAGNVTVTIPLDVQQLYVIKNSCTNSYSVEFKYVSGSGSSVTWASGDTGTKIVYATADDGTNPNIVDATSAFITATSTSTLTNKTLTSPKIGTSILDTNGLQLALLTATSSAVNEITLANAASGSNPTLTASGDDSNIGISFATKGSGVIKAEDSGGTVSAIKIAGTETIWIPSSAMYGSETNGADAQQVETTATRPDLKVLDFDAGTAEYAQFAIAMPKSWNLGTVTYQVFWTPSSTNTGNAIFGLQGLATTEGDTADAVFGTAQEVTDAGIGTVEDVQMTSVSSAMTIAGSPADDDYTFFQLYRDAADGSDTFTGDARVLGIKLFYTTDAANDA